MARQRLYTFPEIRYGGDQLVAEGSLARKNHLSEIADKSKVFKKLAKCARVECADVG